MPRRRGTPLRRQPLPKTRRDGCRSWDSGALRRTACDVECATIQTIEAGTRCARAGHSENGGAANLNERDRGNRNENRGARLAVVFVRWTASRLSAALRIDDERFSPSGCHFGDGDERFDESEVECFRETLPFARTPRKHHRTLGADDCFDERAVAERMGRHFGGDDRFQNEQCGCFQTNADRVPILFREMRDAIGNASIRGFRALKGDGVIHRNALYAFIE